MANNQQSGFSLIELMVAISVLAIAMSIAVPSFQQFIANTQIRSTAESIRNGLQLARAEAVKRNEIVTFTLSNDTSWTVGCVPATANCPATIQSKPVKEGSSSTITLAVTGANAIGFTSLGISTTAPGQMSQVDVDNSSIPATESRELRITIGAGGNARVCDPSVAVVTDSRYCS